MPQRNLHVYQDVGQAVSDLKAGRIEAVWLGLLPAEEYAKDGSVKVAAKGLNQQLYAIALKKGATTLQNRINEALAILQNDGTITKLAQQYLKVPPDEIQQPPILPTPVPPLATPAPPACVDGAGWVADLSYDDQNMTNPPVMQPGQPFTKGWRLRNTGTCPWTTSFTLAFSYGNVPAAQMGGQPIPVTRNVNPGETFDFQVNSLPWFSRNLSGLGCAMRRTRSSARPCGSASPCPARHADPAPTQTPSPNICSRQSVYTAGQPVTFDWATSNAKVLLS
jgi:hypothetical protein